MLLFSLILTSCDPENSDVITPMEPNFEPELVEVNNLVQRLESTSPGGMNLGCVVIEFPFELRKAVAGSVTINSAADYQAAISVDGPNQAVDYVFPLSIIDNRGLATQVNDSYSLGVNFASCVPSSGWNRGVGAEDDMPAFLLEDLCFDLVYPIDLVDIEGNMYTANNEEELVDLFATIPYLFYTIPFSIIDEDGVETEIEGVEEFFSLVIGCTGIQPPVVLDSIDFLGFGCNEIQFPFSLELEDGTIVSVEDMDEYAALLLSGTVAELIYPFTLINQEGENLLITNDQELLEALVACGFEFGPPAELCDAEAHVLLFFNGENIFTVFPCDFSINYPVAMTVNGVPESVDDVNDYFTTTGAPSNIQDVVLTYPITVTVVADGTEVVLESDEDICAFISACD